MQKAMTALGNHGLSYLNDDFVTEKYGVGISIPTRALLSHKKIY